MAVRDAAPVASFPAAIARAGLGAVDEEGDGAATVTFPAPGSAPITISRSWGGLADAVQHAAGDELHHLEDRGAELAHEATDRAQHAASSAADQVRHAASQAGAVAASAAGAGDKLFEDLYDRLKRELLIEQEQLGQLFHEP
jgi:hypothetical protein